MFKLVNRSRSMKSMRTGGGAPGGAQTHGPESPVLGEPGLVSSFQLAKEDSSLSQNESVPSFSSEGAAADAAAAVVEARNTYRHRPLPTPPRSKASSTMAERPSTSGGLSPHNNSTASFRSFADRRISKDDMYIRPQSSARGGFKSYHIPIRDNPASPVESPGDFSPARTFTVRTQTPDSMDSNMGTIAIGMAIGSPTHIPPEFSSPPPPPAQPRNDWQPQASSMSTSMMRASPEPLPSPMETAEPVPAPKQKSGRWKLFGRSKSKRLASSPVAISQPMNLQQPMASTREFESLPPSNQATDLGRRNTERRPGDSKPAMVRSQTAGPMAAPPSPKEQKPPKLLSRMASTRSTREKVKKSDISAPVHVSMHVPALPTKPAGNFLDVEIPSINMERYSVMFGGILQPQGPPGQQAQQQQQQQGASALLARRQATLDRLKTINDQVMKEEEEKERMRGRSATSPQPLKSPAFSLSLFPATPSESANNPPASPRHRSHTSPFPSPSRSSFDPPRPRYYLEAVKAEASGRARTATPDSMRAPQDVPIGFAFGPEQSGLLLDSPTDDRESEEIHLTEQLKPTIYEPAWQMITPSDSTAPSSAAPSAKDRSPASVSSAHTHVTKPSLDESEPDDALKAAVEISIARQISISRSQRRMLRPLKTPALPSGSPSMRSPVSVNTVTIGRNERLSSTKSSTPTLISPGETFEQQIAQNRKSERIIVEGE
ncbi:hypothetical protein K4K49_004590 [Colletotrichum sp. SAR 10_70]|nr:hypothetical protein CGCTS75_v009338 [Colletotrichum tropicale]KAF4874963.1 hypothetical protein CGCSCA1_v005999 [Colletotrichum siamense]KAI8158617.1 hypothetical protein K4K50_003864 [Colletotrichum sp. SAR 10_71]KAI8170623.1 hypothetical protein K4K49_004590 [Colletotrichum sp. SAR 10_70]KAI8178170.1 hypothetical protein KHU50_003397 [Colletotrichum sp. SAR 10_65]KAI8205265.1 hypothetical protein K4K52_004379 [Colletotrichum sp. SAR 10_76]KAI8223687.1 hypothetical protein K4K54_005843 [